MDSAIDGIKLFFMKLMEKNPEIVAWVFLAFIIIIAGIYFINKRMNADIEQKKQSDKRENEIVNRFQRHSEKSIDAITEGMKKTNETLDALISTLQVTQSKIVQDGNQSKRQYDEIDNKINDIKKDINDIKKDIVTVKGKVEHIDTKVSSCLTKGGNKNER